MLKHSFSLCLTIGVVLQSASYGEPEKVNPTPALSIDYESGTLDSGIRGVEAEPPTVKEGITLSTDIRRSGKYAIRYKIAHQDGDSAEKTTYRAESICRGPGDITRYGDGDHVEYRFSIYVPGTWRAAPSERGYIWIWQVKRSSKAADLVVAIHGNRLFCGLLNTHLTLVEELPREAWIDVKLRMRWGYFRQGWLKAYVKLANDREYTLVKTLTGMTMYTERPEDPHLKWGLHKPKFDSSVAEYGPRTIYYDDIHVTKFAPTPEEVILGTRGRLDEGLATVLRVDYETGTLSSGVPGVSAKKPAASDSIAISTDIVRSGKYAVRHKVGRGGDYHSAGATRAESHTMGLGGLSRYRDGDYYQYRFSIYLPKSYEGGTSDIIWQFKRFAGGPDQIVVINGDTINGPAGTLVKNCPRDTWVDIQLRIRWGYFKNGWIKAYVKFAKEKEYTLVGTRKGRNMRNAWAGNYLKWGLYSPNYNGKTKVIYHDDISVSLFKPTPDEVLLGKETKEEESLCPVISVDYETGELDSGGRNVRPSIPKDKDADALAISSEVRRSGKFAGRHRAAYRFQDGAQVYSEAFGGNGFSAFSVGEHVQHRFSMYVPKSWKVFNDDSDYFVWQFKPLSDRNLPDGAVAIKGNNIVLRMNGKTFPLLKDFPRDTWIDLKFQVRWNAWLKSFVKLASAEDYALVSTMVGRNMDGESQPAYLKWGLYRIDLKKEEAEDVDPAELILEDGLDVPAEKMKDLRIVYLDDLYVDIFKPTGDEMGGTEGNEDAPAPVKATPFEPEPVDLLLPGEK